MNIFRVFSLILLAFTIFLASSNADAKKISSAKSYKYKGNPKYASIVVDADTGKILLKDNENKRRHPASLTKMMTLYLAFEALKSGKLKWHQRLKISKEAASRPQTNLSLKSGDKIRVRDVVLGLIIRSANDAAVVMAEALGGSEKKFGKMMTKRAKQLGMKNTVFRNASGLHDPKQVTTAKDMALLAIALKKHYPQYYHYFARKSFSYNGKTYKSHNRVMGRYAGADGLKTGYIRASGFNLVTSAKRSRQNVVGVVLGGRTSKRRDDHMVKLLDKGFVKLAQAKKNRSVNVASTRSTKRKSKPAGLEIAVTRNTGFVPVPISKGYFREGGYEKYAAVQNGKKEAQNAQQVAAIANVIRGKTTASTKEIFIPYPKEKPRFLAQVR